MSRYGCAHGVLRRGLPNRSAGSSLGVSLRSLYPKLVARRESAGPQQEPDPECGLKAGSAGAESPRPPAVAMADVDCCEVWLAGAGSRMGVRQIDCDSQWRNG